MSKTKITRSNGEDLNVQDEVIIGGNHTAHGFKMGDKVKVVEIIDTESTKEDEDRDSPYDAHLLLCKKGRKEHYVCPTDIV